MTKCTKPNIFILVEAVVAIVLLIIEICLVTKIAKRKYKTPAITNKVLTPKRIAVFALGKVPFNKPEPEIKVNSGISLPSPDIFQVLLPVLNHLIILLLLKDEAHFQTEALVL